MQDYIKQIRESLERIKKNNDKLAKMGKGNKELNEQLKKIAGIK